MRRLALFDSVAALLLLAAAASPFLHSNSGAHAATLSALREVTPDSNGVTSLTLTVDAARHVVDGAVTFTSRAYYYQGTAALQGPLIVLRPGGKLNLTLINNLQDDSALDATRPMNTFRHANTTNVHTHGLHVDPAIDSVFRHAAPAGGTLLYDMPIPADHAPGMHWYHSHTHGAATMHIMGGLVGAMYVEWQTRDNIPAAISSLTRHRLIMQFLSFETETRDGVVTQNCAGQTAFNPFKTYSFAELEAESGSTLASSPTYASTDRTFYLINGQFRPSINVVPGESRLIQLVYAAGAKNPALIIPSTCTASHIAFDGVYFDPPRTVTFIQLIVASRVEFVLTCASAGTHSVNVVNNGNIDNIQTTGGTVLFSVIASGTTVTSATVPTTLGITRPSYLTDLQSLTSIDTRNQVSVAQGGSETCKFWIGMGSDCSAVVGGPPRRQTTSTCRFASFTGAKGLTASAHDFVMTVGQTSEWKLIGGGNAPHPLHIHVNHYQIVSYSGSSTVMNHWMRAGEWRDTIPILDGTVTVRFKADTLSGETVVHCHELNHEDKGLMSSFLILPSNDSTTTATSTATVTTPPSPTGTDGNVLPPSFSTQTGNSAVYATPFAWFAGFLAMLAAL